MNVVPFEIHRTRERGHLPIKLRVERLEEDNDHDEFDIREIKEMVSSLKARATALAISFTGASALLVVNLVVGLHGGK